MTGQHVPTIKELNDRNHREEAERLLSLAKRKQFSAEQMENLFVALTPRVRLWLK